MTDEPLSKIDDLKRLSIELADRILDKRAAGQSVAAIEAAALYDAAAVLQHYQVPPPDVLAKAMKVYDEDNTRDVENLKQASKREAEIISLPKTGALPQRVLSMLGFE